MYVSGEYTPNATSGFPDASVTVQMKQTKDGDSLSGDQMEDKGSPSLDWDHPLYLYPDKSKSTQLIYYFDNSCNFYGIITLHAPPLGSKFQKKSTDLKVRVLVSFFFPLIHLVSIYGKLLNGRYCTKC